MLLDETDDRFEVRSSTVPGAGLGLFTRVDLPAGATLNVIGVRVRGESTSDRCTHYTDTHKFRVGEWLLIPVGFGGMVNHSLTPNLEKVIDGDQLSLRALRPIAAGEELFFRYADGALERLGLA